MKNLLFLILILLISCGDKAERESDSMKPKTGISEDLELSGSFFIKQIGNEDVSSEEISLTFDQERKEIRGNAGCNRFSAPFERDGNTITLGDPVGTRMFCDGKMEREKQVMEILPKLTVVRETENNLVFLSNQGEELLIAEKNNNE